MQHMGSTYHNTSKVVVIMFGHNQLNKNFVFDDN